MLLRVLHTHVFGPNFQEKDLLLQFFNSVVYLFIFRNKTDYCMPEYSFAYGLSLLLSRVTLLINMNKRI